ncbi:AMP-binding protein, partial [Streptomyces sp. NRRL S-350]|uniref:AMP-binding protein n=1 Tax=Streptomyces sp. NRRL S-350 TaxID=1463902 RepID=UPI0007C56E0F
AAAAPAADPAPGPGAPAPATAAGAPAATAAGEPAGAPAVAPLSLPDAFTAHARTRPHAPALLWHEHSVSYGELAALADAERARLAALDLAPGEPVGLLAVKSPAAIALVLACLLERRPFLLPSPQLAPALLAALFAQAGARRLLTPRGQDAPALPAPAPAAPVPTLAAGTSFLLTTSGSTGLPKIVPLAQGAVDRFTAWAHDTFDLGPGRTVANYAPLNFDLALLDVWATLAAGGTCLLIDPAHALNARHLLAQLTRHRPHVLQAVPLAYALLVQAAGPGTVLDSVEHAAFTGDAIDARTLAALPALLPAARLYNVYGCTETNDSFLHRLDRLDAAAALPVPIGSPLPGVRTLIAAPDGTAVHGAGSGELYVSTPFQAAGYLDRSRDAGRFTTRPEGAGTGRRWFRTGDLVTRDEQGRVHLTGRADFQVKVRGVAVNTAEVERVLLAHPEVREAAVAAAPDPLTGKRLHAAVQRAPGSRLNTLTLREHLARNLPRAAVPDKLAVHDAPLPKTATGKVDRKAVLPPPPPEPAPAAAPEPAAASAFEPAPAAAPAAAAPASASAAAPEPASAP